MTTLREAAEQALEALDALAYWDGAIAKPAIDALRQALEADTKPCACCGDGNSRLSVTRICDTCGSEYAGQAEMDMAKRIEAEQRYEPVAIVERHGIVADVEWLPASWALRNGDKLYTRQQPAQQPLTDDQLFDVFEGKDSEIWWQFDFGRFQMVARAIERAHGIGGEA